MNAHALPEKTYLLGENVRFSWTYQFVEENQ